ncbi:competence protein CoiA [Paenibacillus elgii]|uniref:competence protein CoiA n=1 Tax=Paenibacillus elgii TaxID=189691 RepID=UPI00203D3931|nr:competence protein CoiA family protein [Paenibacillus elgii]MCM3273043.1 hypothetical protein [Paenibacillus elgii]
MLKALLENRESVLAWEEIKSNKKYYCPECNDTVYLRKCIKKIDHFAHKKSSNCSHGSGETFQHLRMKENVYKLINDRLANMKGYIDHGLEKRLIPERIADVFANFENGKLVFECQHSPISSEDLFKRTADYIRNGIYVIWIFHISRTKRTDFYEKVGKVVIPEEMLCQSRIIMSYRTIYVMDDLGNLRSCYFSENSYKTNKGYVYFNKINFTDMCKESIKSIRVGINFFGGNEAFSERLYSI